MSTKSLVEMLYKIGKNRGTSWLFPRRRPANKIGEMLQMNQRTRDTGQLIDCINKRINPFALEGLCLKIKTLISSKAFLSRQQVNLIGEQLIALSFRLLEVLNQPYLCLQVSFNSSASGNYCLLRHMTTKILFNH
ncbi:hypothetical protein CHARACLAT_032296 [Characodon lateralis]|uniref:Uncharacterized protein n=1 Tax=Characodon lateralis TaxID=208331 RepID=A0ABU7DCE1_9TELE|nr:hypothetical protein [Characodon lateralis]